MPSDENPVIAPLQPADIVVQPLHEPLASERGVQVAVARLDLLGDSVAGNKWYKLCPNLDAARRLGYRRIVSFGGPWSNHIHALARAGRRFNFDTVGVIRGYAHLPLTPTLADAQHWGMQLEFVGPTEYRLKTDPAWLRSLRRRYEPCMIIPEGGSNPAAVGGCSRIMADLEAAGCCATTVVLACGTGATLAGILQRPGRLDKALGVSVLKGDSELCDRVRAHAAGQIEAGLCWDIDSEHHFGGYARTDRVLLEFIEWFYQRHGIALEPVYTGKLMAALYQRLGQGWFAPGERVVALHSGGMQGLRGFCGKWPWARERLAATGHPA